MLRITIPTRGRIADQTTLKSIPEVLHKDVFLFAPPSEARELADRYPSVMVLDQLDEDMTIGRKRHFILDWLNQRGMEKTLMLDDDLFFYTRYYTDDGKPRLLDAKPAEIIHWFGELSDRLSPDTPHGGFGPRQGNQNFPDGWQEGGRMMLALGYHVPTALSVEHGRVGVREDMDVCLQLLRRGLPNMITHEFCVGQKSYAAPGGMTGERTTEMSDAEASRLASLHPGFVRVVDKEYKGHPRKEVVVQWKAALASGRARPQ